MTEHVAFGSVRRSHPIEDLRAQIDKALSDLLKGVQRPALLEFPSYPNIGDSAIWLGQLAYLADRIDRAPYRTADMYSYSAQRLRTQAGVDAILISGGGSLGDLWKWTLEAKTRVLYDFPHVPVVQLAQSVHFVDSNRFDEYRRAVARHRAFTLLVRDRTSFNQATGQLDCDIRLCPDMALWSNLKRSTDPQHDIVCLLRTDKEAGPERPAQRIKEFSGPLAFDWLDEPRYWIVSAERMLTRATTLYPRRLAFIEAPLTLLRQRVAATRVRRGCQLLSSGKVVVTDRLHGHILCLLMDIPHVLLDNSYGKLRRFYDTWTYSCPDAHFATSVDEALNIASSLAATRGREQSARPR